MDHRDGQTVASDVYALPGLRGVHALPIPHLPGSLPGSRHLQADDGIVLIDANNVLAVATAHGPVPMALRSSIPHWVFMTKCNMCYDWWTRVQKPACVQACPYRALDFGPWMNCSKRMELSTHLRRCLILHHQTVNRLQSQQGHQTDWR